MLMRISLAKISGTTQIGFFSPILKNFFPFCLKDTTDEGEEEDEAAAAAAASVTAEGSGFILTK